MSCSTRSTRRGYTIVGPTVRDRAIVYDEIRGSGDLPIGWTDEQDGGHYRLRRRDDEALFGYDVGPHSWKQLPAAARGAPVARPASTSEGGAARRRRGRHATPPATRSSARAPASCTRWGSSTACCSAARIPTRPTAPAREDVFVVAVQCGQAGGTCFCVSMGTGPTAERGFDLALTEMLDGARHYFVVEVGSERGASAARRAAAPPGRRARARRRRRGARARRRADGPRARRHRHQGAALPQLRAPALGRGRRALPDLRQLHDGLPDVLLHDGRGRHRPRRRARRAPPAAGTRASRSTTRTSMAARCAPRRARATASG